MNFSNNAMRVMVSQYIFTFSMSWT